MRKILYYRTFNRENLIYLTLYKETKNQIADIYAIMRFVKGKPSQNGGRTYDNSDYISIKLSLFDLMCLHYALLESARTGKSDYVKHSANEKKIAVNQNYFNGYEKERFIGVKFAKVEMMAFAYELKICAEYGYEALSTK